MGRTKKNRLPPFVAIYKETLKSDAWADLTNASRVAYVHLRSKCVSKDQTEVTLSFREMERYMDPKTYARALKQLIDCGFINREQRGGLFRKRNFYTFPERWKTYQKINSMVEKHHVNMGDIHHVGQGV